MEMYIEVIMQAKTLMIMAGGTGGHVFPALAVAQTMMQRRDNVVWLGSIGGMEEQIVSQAAIPFYGIDIQGIRGKGRMSQLLAPFKICKALYQAMSILRKVKPDVVLGMGGFASGPGGLAAKLMGVPLLIHEQNAIAGLTNKLLSKIANSVMTAFPDVFTHSNNVKMTGNPLRAEITQLFFQERTPVEKKAGVNLLILGGSLGAQSLNEVVPQALNLLSHELRPAILHQTGKGRAENVDAMYRVLALEAKVTEFITDMAAAYKWADFVICRAGALTIAELCAAGLGAILIPYPYAVDDHQTENARFMVEGGAAWLLPQAKLDAAVLADMLTPLLAKRERLSLLSDAARKLAKVDATERVSDECRRICYA
jgi:UDP-N-acetylglucosamine--N-acetylmuramyl-(pentapeptide) pyrophosphoryl-undecaprenol N-acetylglucosamine transferase